jgi:hypothetical protein
LGFGLGLGLGLATLSVAETRRCVRVLYSSYMVSSCWSSLST